MTFFNLSLFLFVYIVGTVRKLQLAKNCKQIVSMHIPFRVSIFRDRIPRTVQEYRLVPGALKL